MSVVVMESLRAWWPEILLSAGALLVILSGAWSRRGTAPLVAAWITLVASGVALGHTPVLPQSGLFSGLVICDPISLAIRWIALVTVGLVVLMIMGSREVDASLRGEYVGLVLLIGVGLMIMAEANHLLMAYLGVELVSLTSYILVGLVKDARSAEASLKYLLFGALSSGVMLFGMSLLFGLTGELAFPRLQQAVAGLSGPAVGLLLTAVALLLAGVAFKISMVPFHLWTPDAYEGAPIPVAALLSVGPKAAGLALLLRLMEALGAAWPEVVALMLTLTVITMTLGNVVALVQTNAKRLLAYSTIGQVGYLLIGFVVNSEAGRHALLVYLVAYCVMNLGLFACLVAVANDARSDSLEAFQGLAQRAPALAAACAIFLLSLAGIPPLAGFIGKFLLFGAALQAELTGLAIVAAVNSALALYYYVNIIRLMYFGNPKRSGAPSPSPALTVALGACALATVLFGLFPGPLLDWLRTAAHVNLL